MSYQCQFCDKVFSTKYNLATHQKTTKKCLDIQNGVETKENYTCEYCDYSSVKKGNLDRHLLSCKQKEKTKEKLQSYERIVSEKDKVNTDLKIELINLKVKIEAYEKTITDQQKMITKLNNVTNNTNITYKQSEATFHPYKELKNNIDEIQSLIALIHKP